MSRRELINAIKAAAGLDDRQQLSRLYCNNRISKKAFDEAVEQGRKFAEFCRKRDEQKTKEQAP